MKMRQLFAMTIALFLCWPAGRVLGNDENSAAELKLEGNQLSALTQLTFRSNHIDAKLLQGLDQLKNLKTLNLASFGSDGVITDDGLAELRKFLNLETLNLTGCENLTPGQFELLKKALPKCKVTWNIPK